MHWASGLLTVVKKENFDHLISNMRLLTGGEASDDARGFGAAGAGFDCVSAQNQPMVNRVYYVV